jgi:ribonucleoside-diphosphate reductase alpha chain
MIATHLVLEEEHLKRLATTPKDQKLQFEWSSLLGDIPKHDTDSHIKVRVGTHERDFDLGEIANTVGSALTDLFIAREQKENIFSDENQKMVQATAIAVAKELQQRAKTPEGTPRTLPAHEIYSIIESALIKANKHDVAKSVVVRRQRMEKEIAPRNDAAAADHRLHQGHPPQRSGRAVEPQQDRDRRAQGLPLSETRLLAGRADR